MRKRHTIECDRCGIPVVYSSTTGYRNAKKRHEEGAFLCKACKGETGVPNLIFTSRNTAILECPRCHSQKELKGATHIRNYTSRYGRSCYGYVCAECRKKDAGDKICSVCGRHEPHRNEESRRKFLKRYADHPYVCPECRRKKVEDGHVLTCRECGEKRVLKGRGEICYWKYQTAHGKTYVCENCRKLKSKHTVQPKMKTLSFVSTKEYKELLGECKRAYSVAVSRGLTDDAITGFLNDITSILEPKFVFDYDLNVADGKVLGIYLHRVSVYGEVYLPFENTSKAFGRRGIPS